MDLCCLIDSGERLSASDLVVVLGDLLERGQSLFCPVTDAGSHSALSETKFHVKPLPHARIPIVKLSLDPSPGLPSGIACDIGFENKLALENTRLLMCYAMIDPTRIRILVLFRKSRGSFLQTSTHLPSHSPFSQGVEQTQVSTQLDSSSLELTSQSRKINSPYHGTLSSYGYVLLVLYFLIHVKNPPVLPNLQQIPPLHPISKASHHFFRHYLC